MTIRKQEVIAAALQLERDGRGFYLDVVAKTSNALAQRMFESLADDELRHIEWIEKLSVEQTAEAANQELYQRLSHIFAQAPELVRREAEMAQDDIQAIQLGIDMEERSKLAYQKWAEESNSDDLRLLCNTLAEAEQYHKELLDNTLKYLVSSIDWFM